MKFLHYYVRTFGDCFNGLVILVKIRQIKQKLLVKMLTKVGDFIDTKSNINFKNLDAYQNMLTRTNREVFYRMTLMDK